MVYFGVVVVVVVVVVRCGGRCWRWSFVGGAKLKLVVVGGSWLVVGRGQ